MTDPKKIFRIFLRRLELPVQKITPGFRLPILAGVLMLFFFTVNFILHEPGSYLDELGFTGDNDAVTLDVTPEEKKPAASIEKIRPGESLYSILSVKGLTPADIDSIVRQLKGSFSVHGFLPGHSYETQLNGNGSLQRFSYFPDRATAIHIERQNGTGGFFVRCEVREYATRIETLEGTLSGTLSQALRSKGRSTLLVGMKNLFSSRINFSSDITPGTKYRILFEEKWLGDEFVTTGKILAVELLLKNRTYRAYHFADAKGKSGYFDESGNAFERTAMFTSPCSYSRISSGFGFRVHPLFRTRHFHGGIDMAASSGTPVHAVADGKIIFRGRKGGAGNMVTLAHSGGYHTQYLHLSRFSGKAGYSTKIRQGEIIGYVGSTGSSTGPHLDFRMIRNGKPINPIAALGSAASSTVARAEKGHFLAAVSAMKAQLDKSRILVAGSPRTKVRNRTPSEAV